MSDQDDSGNNDSGEMVPMSRLRTRKSGELLRLQDAPSELEAIITNNRLPDGTNVNVKGVMTFVFYDSMETDEQGEIINGVQLIICGRAKRADAAMVLSMCLTEIARPSKKKTKKK